MEKQPDWTLINEGMEAAQNRHSGAMSPSEVLSELEKIRARPPAKYEAQRAKDVEPAYTTGDKITTAAIYVTAGTAILGLGYLIVQMFVAVTTSVVIWISANGGIVTAAVAGIAVIVSILSHFTNNKNNETKHETHHHYHQYNHQGPKNH